MMVGLDGFDYDFDYLALLEDVLFNLLYIVVFTLIYLVYLYYYEVHYKHVFNRFICEEGY